MSDVTTVVLIIGSEKTHVVTVPAALVVKDGWSSFGVTFTGIRLPLVAHCGTGLRLTQRSLAAVVMRPGTKVRCRPCAFHSGLTEQPSPDTQVSP